MFNKVKHIEHIEPFLAVKSMAIDDLVFLYVGQQDKTKESGVYAYGEIIKGHIRRFFIKLSYYIYYGIMSSR